MRQYIENIFHILLTRLQKSRTERYVFRFVEFTYFLAAVDKPELGPAFVKVALDQQGQGLFGQLLQMFILPKTPQIKGKEQIIGTIVGATRFLTELTDLQTGQYTRFWYFPFPPASPSAIAQLCRRDMLVAMVHLQQAENYPAAPDDEIEDIDIEESGFQAAYARLAVAVPPAVEIVPFTSVNDALKNFAGKLAADTAAGGTLLNRIRREVPQEDIEVLRSWGVAV